MDDTYKAMTTVTDGHASLDGCPAVATMFTLVNGNGELAPGTQVGELLLPDPKPEGAHA